MARGHGARRPLVLPVGCALSLLLAALAVFAFVTVFGSGIPGITDQGGEPPVVVVNNSGVEVVVAYHFTDPQSGQDLALPVEVRIPSGQSGPFYLAGHAGQCAGGRLVAVHGAEPVASLDGPCPGAIWRLGPDSSPSGS